MDKSPSTKKGQMSSVDFLFASIIFVFILAFFTGFWYVTTGDLDNTIKRNRLEATAVVASDLLIKSPGVPSNWTENPSTILAIGLVSQHNVFDKIKLENFTSLDYNSSSELLGLSQSQGFYFYIEDLDGNRKYQTGNSSANGQVVFITRYGILNGQKVKMRLMIYE